MGIDGTLAIPAKVGIEIRVTIRIARFPLGGMKKLGVRRVVREWLARSPKSENKSPFAKFSCEILGLLRLHRFQPRV